MTKVVSTRVSGRILLERLQQVLDQCRLGVAEVPRGRVGINRQWLAKKIGCNSITLSQSTRLKSCITRWEREHKFKPRSHDQNHEENEVEGGFADAGNVIALKLPDRGEIKRVSCRLRGQTCIIPTVVWRDGVEVASVDWIRSQVRRARVTVDTAEESAKVYRLFARYRRAKGIPWDMVDDDVLIGWRLNMSARGISTPRRNYCLSLIHAFYRWAEETGRLRFHVRIGGSAFYPRSMADHQFPISSVEVNSKTKGRIVTRWQTPLTERGGYYKFKHTPTTDEIIRLFDHAADDEENGFRNSLMMSWALECGARLNELLQPTVRQMPTDEQLAQMNEDDEWPILVTRKGRRGAKEKIFVSADLIRRTLDYIEFERQKIVDQMRAKGIEASEHIFISTSSGQRLHNDSVTRICRKIFRLAGVERANIHRLRAAYITRIVEQCLDAMEKTGNTLDLSSPWNETVLTMAAQLMGHTSVRSLRPYLNRILTRRLQTSPGVRSAKEETTIRQTALRSKDFHRRLKNHPQLVEVARMFEAGDEIAAGKALRKLALEASPETLPMAA